MKKRIATGLIGGAAFLSLVYYGGFGYGLLLFFIVVIGFFEWLRMNHIHLWEPHGLIGMLFAIYYFLPASMTEPLWQGNAILLEVLLLLLICVFSKNKITIHHVSYVLVGSIYIGMAFHYMLETRLLADGLLLTVAVLIATWSTDIAAYFVGKAIGKRKLWPAISPNKTIEGSLGGVGLAVIALAILSFFADWSLAYAIILALVISISGQLGDLMESAVKRVLDVKDSGQILPGHGGVLDRFDSLMFVFPVLHLLSLF